MTVNDHGRTGKCKAVSGPHWHLQRTDGNLKLGTLLGAQGQFILPQFRVFPLLLQRPILARVAEKRGNRLALRREGSHASMHIEK